MRLYDIGAREGPEVVSERVVTLPNLISALRILVLPWVFVDLVAGRHLRALVVLSLFAATDWIDGYVARRFGQVSRLGKLLDPLSDRLLIAVVGIAMILADLVPLWAILVLIARDVVLVLAAALFLSQGVTPPAVTRTGKTATFGLMFALPLFVLASVEAPAGEAAHGTIRALAWATYGLSAFLYYVAAGQYTAATWRGRRRSVEAVGATDPRGGGSLD